MGIRLMEPKAKGRQPGSRNYTQEFRESVAAEANDPNRSIAEVARSHGLNANMVAQWRRRSLEARQARADEPMSCAELLPVTVVDAPVLSTQLATSPAMAEETRETAPANCDIEIEVGKRRVRIRGLSVDRAEQFLRDCLK